MASSVASNNQPSTEGQHGHGTTQRQQISGVVHLEADGLFERRNNQAHNNHIEQIVLQALEAVHRENVCVLLLQPPRRGSRSNFSSVRSLTTESQVLPATRDGTKQETCLRRALILKIQKMVIFICRAVEIGRGALPFPKTIVLMALAVVHGQSRGCL